MNKEELHGCETLQKLWEVAKVCNIDNPGITGTPDRLMNFVQCGNVMDFMTMSTMKCWEERGEQGLPPLVVKKTIYRSSDSSKNNSDNKQSGSKN